MELRQLIYFDAIVHHGGFTRAAQHLHVAQTAISAQIRKLERDLGVTLLSRTTRRVQLTHAGELVLARARRILDEATGIRADISDVSGVLRGRVRIGAVDALDPFNIDGALATFTRQCPGVELRLRTAPTGAQLMAALDADDIDIALAPIPADLADNFRSDTLFSEELVIITAVQHRRARAVTLPFADLDAESFVSFPIGTGLRRILDDAAHNAGFTAHVPFETTSLTRIRGMVSNGLGIALVARSIADMTGPPVTVHSVDPHPIHRAIGLVQHKSTALSPAAEACREVLLRWRHQSSTDWPS